MSEILQTILRRASVRVPYDPLRPISRKDLEEILEAARWAPTAHNMQNFEIVVVDDPKLLEALAKIKNPISMEFIKENYQQLSFSEAELKKKKTGVLATRFPPAWSNPKASMSELEAAQRPLPTAPTMLFVVYDSSRRAPASQGDFLGAISLGCATENMWLTAAALGVAFHIVSPYAGGPVEKEVKRLLAVPEALRIVYAIRLGYPATPMQDYLRVRREVQDFTHHNRFGHRDLG